MEQLDETVEVLDKHLEMSKKANIEARALNGSLNNLCASRQEIELELDAIENQKNRISVMEEQVGSVDEKLNLFDEAKEVFITVEERITDYNIFKEKFDDDYGEIQDRKKYIEDALLFIENSRLVAQKSNQKSEKLLQQVDRTELRQEHLNNNLQKLDLQAGKLESIKNKSQEIEARFEQMDGLMIDLEQKKLQILGMSNRFSEMEKSGENTLTELNSMFSEADEKIDKLTGFYNMVDVMLESRIAQEKEDYNLVSNNVKTAKSNQLKLPEHKQDGILSLYLNHKWKAELISERMKIDLALVKTVIANHARTTAKK